VFCILNHAVRGKSSSTLTLSFFPGLTCPSLRFCSSLTLIPMYKTATETALRTEMIALDRNARSYTHSDRQCQHFSSNYPVIPIYFTKYIASPLSDRYTT
jgi:hypothetical protein